MLRASTQVSGEEVNLKGIVEGNQVQTGLRGGEALIHFAETAVGDNVDAISVAREAVKDELGEKADGGCRMCYCQLSANGSYCRWYRHSFGYARCHDDKQYQRRPRA